MTRMSEIPPELLNEMTPAVRAFVEALCARIREQDQIIATQQKRIEELERRLGMNSGNSSLPPSSDRPGQQPVSTAKPKSKRKRGGQAGHVKRTRSLIPTEACDRDVHHRPGACSDCGAKLSRGQLPATVPRGCFGPESWRSFEIPLSDTRSPKRAQMAELMANRQVQPGDEATISVLKTLAIDDDPRVHRAATVTLRHLIADAQNTGQQSSVNPAAEAAWVRGLNDQDELVQWQAALAVLEQNDVQSGRNTRLSAITILGRAQDRDSVEQAVPALLRVIEESRDDACRKAAIQSLGRIGPAISVGWSNAGNQAIFRLALELERPGVSERKLAAEALAAMGPAANAAVPSFGRAWEKQLLTLNDAQLLYLIDPEAAEKLQIARPNAPPQQ